MYVIIRIIRFGVCLDKGVGARASAHDAIFVYSSKQVNRMTSFFMLLLSGMTTPVRQRLAWFIYSVANE